jgi:GH24 family phage-related lysozyme (muramidase)
MINFPSQFNIGDESKPVIGSGLLQPSILAQADVRPLRLVPITGTAQSSELSASSSPKLATPQQPESAPSTPPSWISAGYDYNAKNEGVVRNVYLDLAAKPPLTKDKKLDVEKMKKDGRWAQNEKGKWGMKTAGSGWTTDKNGNAWDNSMIGKEVISEEEDRQRFSETATKWDAHMSKNFPELWKNATDRQKATLKSFEHNVGAKYFREKDDSKLHKQMKEGNWAAVSFNIRTWAWKRNADGSFAKKADGSIVSNNELLESRRQRDEEGTKPAKKK